MFGIEFGPKKYEHICLSPPGVKLGGSKDWQVRSIILKGNSKLHSIYGSMLPKLPITSKKLQIKVIWNWIFSKKIHKRICLSAEGVELWGSKILSFFWCDVYFWQRFPYRIILRTCQSFKALGSTRAGDKHNCRETFLYEIQFRTTFIWSSFLMRCLFLAALSPKLNVIYCFPTE